MISFMLLYVICKMIGYQNNPDQKSKCAYACHYIMKQVDIMRNLLRDNMSSWYVCMSLHEV